jgi:hypothetical protein
MSIVALLVIVGIILLGVGLVRSNMAWLVLSGILLADALALYVIFGPAAQAARTLFSR